MKEDIRISLNGLLPIIFLDMWGATNPTNPTIPPRWTDEAVSIPTKTIDINLILLGFTERVLGIFPPRSNTFKLLASINAEKIDTHGGSIRVYIEKNQMKINSTSNSKVFESFNENVIIVEFRKFSFNSRNKIRSKIKVFNYYLNQFKKIFWISNARESQKVFFYETI